MTPHVKNPATVVKLVNHENTCSAELCTLIKHKNEKAPVVRTATTGRPAFVQYAKTFGAWPRVARPYRIRDAQNRKELDAESAEVKTAALMIDGSTLIPAREMAMTYGDSAALPVSASKFGSLKGTSKPVMRIPRSWKRKRKREKTVRTR